MGNALRPLAVRTASAVFVVASAACWLTDRDARANGFEQPVDVDRPAPPVPGGVLPFPVVDEPVPTGSALTTKDLSRDAVSIATSVFPSDAELKNAAGASRRVFEGAVVRQSRIAPGKVTIPAGGVTYFAEVTPPAPPLDGARLAIFGAARILVDVDQTIVMRKGVTLPLGEPVVLGSSAFTYASYAPLAGTASAGVTAATLAGFEWGRVGLGGFEISVTQPSWHSKTFRDGLVQGRIEEVTPSFVRLAWLSATRTERVVVADEEAKGALVKGGEDIALDGGRHVKVTRVDAGGRVTLETPDGAKTLAIDGDPKRLVEDADARKKLLFVGKDYAVACLPGVSDFAHGKAYVAVYAKVHVYKRGEALDDDAAWRVTPVALPNGHLLGIGVTNDKAIELTPDQPAANGPARAFRVTTTWSGAELETFGVDDGKGEGKGRVPAKGRASIDFIAGNGPTIESLRARSGIASPSGPPTAAPSPAAPPPTPVPPEPPKTSWRDDPVGFARPHFPWLGGGAAGGFLLAWIFGAFRRRSPREYS
jgi:hypothetical protein